MRGKRADVGVRRVVRGSIPARAGETWWWSTQSRLPRVHPRACGGNEKAVNRITGSTGPSPRVRGKLLPILLGLLDGGSIPARAGETAAACSSFRLHTVHPRACGGNRTRYRGGFSRPGPSPRVREKRVVNDPLPPGVGSIPARAGETHFGQLQFLSQRVHPRACGGNPVPVTVTSAMAGPSPRVRGKLVAFGPPCGLCRSIPARAGETLYIRSRTGTVAVHPRACGGNMESSLPARFDQGPSPRVRGKRRDPGVQPPGGGSIPARAGETFATGSSTPPTPVHPRACGGNIDDPPVHSLVLGPSPRVRGKRSGLKSGCGTIRSIPARAGETSCWNGR